MTPVKTRMHSTHVVASMLDSEQANLEQVSNHVQEASMLVWHLIIH